MSIICEGTPVTIIDADGLQRFCVLDLHEQVVHQVPVPASGAKRDRIFFYNFDPLTSELQQGLDSLNYSAVCVIRELQQLPVEEPYVIDALDHFYDKTLPNHYVWEKACDPSFTVEFWDAFLKFLRSKGDVYLGANTSVLTNVDFTDLGLDFMRQHYRSIKRTAISSGHASSSSNWSALLESTISNRTIADDWRGTPGKFSMR